MAAGGIVFNDTFTEASSDTNLDLHTPDTGTGWTNVFTAGSAPVGTIQAVALTDLAEDTADFAAGRVYSADATYPSADYQVKVKYVAGGTSDDTNFLLARMDGTAADSYFTSQFSSSTSYNPILGKRVSSTFTSLITHENGALSSSIVLANAIVMLQVLGSDISFYSATSNESETEVAHLFTTDTAISATNKAGLGTGAYRNVDDDMGSNDLDNFQVVEIGDTVTSWANPTTTGEISNDFTNPTNAYSSDNVRATSTTVGHKQDYGDFGFSIVAGSTIRGIQVKVEGHSNAATTWARFGVEVSNDNGTSWSSVKNVEFEGTTDVTKVVGHANSLWGLSWVAADLNDSDFRVRLSYVAEQSTSATLNIDHIQVKVISDSLTEAGVGVPATLLFMGVG